MIGLKAKLTAAAIVAALGFGGGWFVKSKFAAASEAADLRATIRAMNHETERLKKFNDAQATREKEILAMIGQLRARIEAIDDEIDRTDVGTCRITADGDRLRQSAYDAALPPR